MVQDEEIKRNYTATADGDLLIYTLDKTSFTNIEDSFIKFNTFEFNIKHLLLILKIVLLNLILLNLIYLIIFQKKKKLIWNY